MFECVCAGVLGWSLRRGDTRTALCAHGWRSDAGQQFKPHFEACSYTKVHTHDRDILHRYRLPSLLSLWEARRLLAGIKVWWCVHLYVHVCRSVRPLTKDTGRETVTDLQSDSDWAVAKSGGEGTSPLTVCWETPCTALSNMAETKWSRGAHAVQHREETKRRESLCHLIHSCVSSSQKTSQLTSASHLLTD